MPFSTLAPQTSQSHPVQAMQNPLEQLRDIHLPEPVSEFFLAPGWIVIAAVLFSLLIFALLKWNKKRRSLRLLKPALAELEDIARLTPDSQAIAKLSALLKRVCLLYFPKPQVASLSGERWIAFLNRQTGTQAFTPEQQKAFGQIAYQANLTLETDQWKQLTNDCKIALEQIIRKAAKQQLKLIADTNDPAGL